MRATYGVVAASYARELSDELDGLPFERWLLDRVAVAAGDLPVMDAGCGPGHVTAYLAAAGADARGLDVSPEMVAEARQRHPDVHYEVGDLRRLMRPAAAAGWGAVLGVVLPHPPRGLRAARRRRCPGPAARTRRAAGAGAARG